MRHRHHTTSPDTATPRTAIQAAAYTAAHTVVPIVMAAMIAATAPGDTPAHAADAKPAPSTDQGEYWIGVEGFRDVLAMYGGVTWAPLGGMSKDGLRLRASGTFSRYDGSHPFTTVTNVGNTVVESTSLEAITGQRSTARALIGWHMQTGPLTTKMFVGAAVRDDSRLSPSSGQKAHRLDFGAAAAIELWYDISDTMWTAIDLSYASPDEELSGRARLGFRFNDKLSIGPELAHTTTTEGSLTKAGAFIRYDNGLSEVNVSVGAAIAEDDEDAAAYVGVQWLQRF